MRWIAIAASTLAAAALAVRARSAPVPTRAPQTAPDTAERPAPMPLTRNALRGDLVGCYTVTAVAPPGGKGRGEYLFAAPRVRLDTAVVWSPPPDDPEVPPGVERRLRRFDAAGRPLPRLPNEPDGGPSWTADSLTDTVRLLFSTGFSGARVALAAPPRALRPRADRSDTLRGRAVNTWDYGPRFETDPGPASAVRVPCP